MDAANTRKKRKQNNISKQQQESLGPEIDETNEIITFLKETELLI